MDNVSLYHNRLMAHFRSSRYRRDLECANFSASESNPLCGDRVVFQGHVAADTLDEIAFQGAGCVISQAAASLLSERVQGQKCDEVLQLSAEQMRELVGIPLGPVRLRCALLPLEALKKGITGYRMKQKGSDAQSDTAACRG